MATRKKKAAKGASRKRAFKKSTAQERRTKTSDPSPPPIAGKANPALWLVGVALTAAVVLAVVVSAQGGDQGEREAEPEAETVDLSSRQLGTIVPEALRINIVARYPHDTRAFTQGLLWHQGKLYESTGLEGRSTLRRVDLESGRVERSIDVDEDLFAEGLARVGERLFQLTWQSEKLLVYDLRSFELLEEIDYQGEGWGLCYDGTHLVMSDGSDRLRFRDPESFDVVRTLRVTKVGRPLRRLNELECADNMVYANVWQRDEIVRIDPLSGRVMATIDAQGLLRQNEQIGTGVLNGIAWLPDRGRFILTGKLWPTAFEVAFVPRD